MSNKNEKRGRGRPHKTLALPKSGQFTISDIAKLNNVARLTIYNQINDGTLQIRQLRGQTRPTGGPGKPGDIFVRLETWKRSQASKKAAKARKQNLAAVPPVDLTPAPVAEVAPVAPVAPVA